jgi:hypothetical protein
MLLALAFLTLQGSPFPIISREPKPVIALREATSRDDLGEPRTLENILWSCFFTIFLCNWVSLHPNIPGPDEKWWRIKLRRVGLAVVALLAPEMIVSLAMRQRAYARQLAKEHQGEFVDNRRLLAGLDQFPG